ncbi:MAG: HEPN domain-containing protein [Clostridiales bacterium]|jgi:HEPN domain-containing protein|nr:HEPN domain-containing protein [Clostridiales bacterium]
MDYYSNAVETEQAARVLYDAEMYRQAIYLFCLAIELYLKSRLYLVKHNEDLALSHDIIGLYHALNSRFASPGNLEKLIAKSRKYFNEARYPYTGDTGIYTRGFADGFINAVTEVKQYVDTQCVATEDDLQTMFRKNI